MAKTHTVNFSDLFPFCSLYSSVTEEYQDGKNSYCEFFGLVPFLQLAIHVGTEYRKRLYRSDGRVVITPSSYSAGPWLKPQSKHKLS
jgi:hypothetical protein